MEGSFYVNALNDSRRKDEDEYYIGEISNDVIMYAIFDGHGGPDVSTLLKNHLRDYLHGQLHGVNFDDFYDVAQHITDAYTQFDIYIERLGIDRVGSTAIVIILTRNNIYIVNLGDSRAVMFSPSVTGWFETVDHKPNSPTEKMHIESMGGKVIHYGVWRVDGSLAVSRAFGDIYLKPKVNIHPDIYRFKRSEIPRDTYIFLASDGIFDVFNSQHVVDILKRDGINRHTVDRIVDDASRRTSDDITAMLIKV